MDRPRGVDAYVAARTHAGKAAQQIADELNAAGVVTASGRPLSTNVVATEGDVLRSHRACKSHLSEV